MVFILNARIESTCTILSLIAHSFPIHGQYNLMIDIEHQWRCSVRERTKVYVRVPVEIDSLDLI